MDVFLLFKGNTTIGQKTMEGFIKPFFLKNGEERGN
jgi:hypothetical protein